MIAALVLAAGLVGPPAPCPPALARDCRDCLDAVQEARRVRRDVLVRGSAMAASHFGDLASTAYFKHRFACASAPPGQPCIVEENKAFPLTVGLFAGKGLYVLGGTYVEYELDSHGHRGWAKVITWVVSAAGVVPAGINLVRGPQVHRARAR